MATVGQMMHRFERLNVRQLAEESIQETKVDFQEWQKEQLFEGKKNTGGRITPFYRPATIREKKRKGQPTDRVTLKDTGFFHNSIFLVVKKGTGLFSVVSSDRKGPWLIDKYGDSIFGLGGVYKVGYVKELRPVLIGKVRDILNV